MKNTKKYNYTISFPLAPKLQHCLFKARLHTLPNPSVKVYNNADLQKKQILLENKEKSGVYR